MKKIFIPLFILTGLLGFSLSVHAESKIYKYTDIDGNVHYTDKKPFAEAKEEDLPPIVVIPAKKYTDSTSNWKRQDRKQKQAAKEFTNFVITTPSAGATLSGTGGNVLVKVSLEEKLRSNYRIKFYIDGLPHGKVKSNTQLIADVVRGEHTVYAEMIEASTRKVILTTPKSIFYLRQHSKK